MKLIQAMKQIKELQRKAADLHTKIGNHCVDLNIETPTYGDRQRQQVDEWLQACFDLTKEILRLRVAIQRTNLETSVTIRLGEKDVTKSVAEWIHRRRDLAALDMAAWNKLTDRNLKESNVQTSPGGAVTEVRIRRYFDPAVRDKTAELFRGEPSTIDAQLEVTNAITDLIEA